MATTEELRKYLEEMVQAVKADAVSEVKELPVTVGVALQQMANNLNADPTNEDIIGRLRAALLLLAGEDVFEVMPDLLHLARSGSPSAPTVLGGLGGLLGSLGTPNLGAQAAASATTSASASGGDAKSKSHGGRQRQGI